MSNDSKSVFLLKVLPYYYSYPSISALFVKLPIIFVKQKKEQKVKGKTMYQANFRMARP